MIILAFETSCDETSAAVVKDGREVLSNVVYSQMSTHERFGGVVPEVASREHVKSIIRVIDEALSQAGVEAKDLDAVAVTEGPGLIGSLLVGINAAKAFAFAHAKPLLGVHHIAGHIYANQAVTPMAFPLLCLVVSGGHTELILMKDHMQFTLLGQTQDDAIGEAYDKVARVMGLGYPGGPKLDALAQTIKSSSIKMPKTQLEGFDFSYSGLKSHVINTLNTAKMKGETLSPEALAFSFQEAALGQLIEQTRKALNTYDVKQVLLAGGVAANGRLRSWLEQAVAPKPLTVPPLSLCTDNAGMIGLAAYYQHQREGLKEGLAINGYSRQTLFERYR